MVSKTYPQWHYYETLKKGDESETCRILLLDNVICRKANDEHEGEADQIQVQLILDDIKYKNYRNLESVRK